MGWCGAIKQLAISWTNIDKCRCRHLGSPGYTELRTEDKYMVHTCILVGKRKGNITPGC